MRPAVGDHIVYRPNGDYLGVVTAVSDTLVHFDGPSTRAGNPTRVAGFGQVDVLETEDDIPGL